MKTTRHERITTKPVTVQQEVRQAADIPTIDFTRLVVEVTDDGRGSVYLNGVLLEGVRCNGYSRERAGSTPYQMMAVTVAFATSRGVFEMRVDEFIVTPGLCPQTVEWKDKPPTIVSQMVAGGTLKGPDEFARGSTVCCVPGCCASMATLRSNGSYRCNKHFDQLHPTLR